METPNLNRIVDTFIQITNQDPESYFAQLRSDLILPIRKLQKDKKLRWYSFLVHGANQLSGRTSLSDKNLFIHIRLEPEMEIEINDFIEMLPSHFQQPINVTLSGISGVDQTILRDKDFVYAWKMLGETSEWVFQLIENHAENSLHIKQITQFLHFITNPLLLGNQCFYAPTLSSF